MARGLRVRDPATGWVIFEMSDSLPKLLGSFGVSSTGSLYVPEFIGNTPFVSLNYNARAFDYSFYSQYPEVWVDGGTLNWYYPPAGAGFIQQPAIINYGVF